MTEERWTEVYRQSWPMATDHDKGRFPYRQARSQALQRRYIQANPSALITSLVFDVDHEDTLLRVLSTTSGIPAPSYVAQSSSGKGHVGYLLETPVCRTDSARLEPIRYAARVEAGLMAALEADRSYAGFMTKNPVHEHWDTFWGTDQLYTLRELAVQLPGWMPRTLPRRAVDSSGLGRNVTLFNLVRLWSYRAILRHRDGGLTAWEEVVTGYALSTNHGFPAPLNASEVGHLARSVARWTWRNLTAEGFTALQTERSNRAATKRSINRATLMEVLGNGG